MIDTFHNRPAVLKNLFYVAVIVLIACAVIFLWQQLASRTRFADGGIKLVGALAKDGAYYTIRESEKDESRVWYIYNSLVPAVSQRLEPLVGQTVTISAKLLTESGDDVTLLGVNGETLTDTERAQPRQVQYLDTVYAQLADSQRDCVHEVLGEEYIGKLVRGIQGEISPDKIAPLNACLVTGEGLEEE